MVSTIAVKRSNRSASLKVGKYGGQTNSTNFHLGQGEARKEVSPSDSSFKYGRQYFILPDECEEVILLEERTSSPRG